MTGTGGFQTQVFVQPAVAIEGDRANDNPLYSYSAGPGGLVAGTSLIVGRFAWVTTPIDPNGGPTVANSFGSGAPAGFLMRAQQSLQTTFLANAGMQVQVGYGVDLQIEGDFWVRNNGTTEAIPGQKAYANFADGTATFAATGAPTSGPTSTGSSIAASTFSVTGFISNNIMTVTAVGSGTVVNGATISGTGILTGTTVLNQLTGTAGGIGTYTVSTPELTAGSAAAPITISGTYGTLTIGTLTSTAVFAVNQIITGSGVVAGTTITQLLTGTGGTGSTFAVSNNTVVGSTAIAGTTNWETKFFARTSGLAQELVHISSRPTAGNA